jgi:hypothetical protein
MDRGTITMCRLSRWVLEPAIPSDILGHTGARSSPGYGLPLG